MQVWILRTFRWWCAYIAQWFKHLDPDPSKTSLTKLRNIDRHTSQSLERIGIHDRADLVRFGALEAYEQISQLEPDVKPDLVLCLHGAITNQHLTQIPEKQKIYLLEEVAASPSKQVRF